MFLLNPITFAWDAAILVLLSGSAGTTALALLMLKKYRTLKPRWPLWVLAAIGDLAFLTVLYGSFIEPQIIVTTRHDVSIQGAPALRIAVLSDPHIGPYKNEAYLRRVVEKTNALQPDIVLLAGDYVFTSGASVEQLRPLGDLQAAYGVFAVIGNHDHGIARTVREQAPQERAGEIAALFTDLGISVLDNRHEVLEIGGKQIAIAGVDDVLASKADSRLAMRNIPSTVPVILLAHNPDVIQDTLTLRAQLIVAGHTHGGQIRLPFLGSVPPLPTELGRPYDQGLFPLDDDTTLAITRGVGESGVRARLFAWPEILLLSVHSL